MSVENVAVATTTGTEAMTTNDPYRMMDEFFAQLAAHFRQNVPIDDPEKNPEDVLGDWIAGLNKKRALRSELIGIRTCARYGRLDGYFDKSRQLAVARYVERFAVAKGMIDDFNKKHYDEFMTFQMIDSFLSETQSHFKDLFPGVNVPKIDIKR